MSLHIAMPKGQTKVNSLISFTGRQTRMRRRSVEARFTRKVFVGDLNELFLITVRMMRRLPDTPKQKIKLQ